MEIDILCLLREPSCHLLVSDFGEIVLQTCFEREMAKHLPYIPLLKFGICLQVASSPPRLTAALTTATPGELHSYTSCCGRMGSSTHQNSLFVPIQRLYLAGSPETWTKRSYSMFQLCPQLGDWWNLPQNLFWLQRNLSKRSMLLLHLFYTLHPHYHFSLDQESAVAAFLLTSHPCHAVLHVLKQSWHLSTGFHPDKAKQKRSGAGEHLLHYSC